MVTIVLQEFCLTFQTRSFQNRLLFFALETPGKPHNLTGNFADTNRSSFRLRWETPLNLANHPKKGITYRIRLCHIERETFTVTIPPTTTPLATTARSTPISLKVNDTSSFENNVTLTDIPENNTKNLTKTNSTKVPITPAKRAKNVEDGADINPSTTEETPTEEVPTEEVPTGPLRDRRRRAEPELDSSEEEESDSLGSQTDTVSVRNTTNVTAPPATRTVVVFKLVNCSQFEDIRYGPTKTYMIIIIVFALLLSDLSLTQIDG